jgi:hypothetical protein
MIGVGSSMSTVEEKVRFGSGGRQARRTVFVDTSSSTDDLTLILLEVNDGATTQGENGKARDVLRGGSVVRSKGSDIRNVDFGFELGPRELQWGMVSARE